MEGLQMLWQWLIANWVLISLIVFGLVTLAVVRDWRNAKDAARDLFLLAEKALAAYVIKTGPEAMQSVVKSLYEMLPERVRKILSIAAALGGTTPEQLLRTLVQKWYDEIGAKYGKDVFGRTVT